MIVVIALILYTGAVVLFALAASGVVRSIDRLTAAGLLCLALVLLITEMLRIT